MRTEVKAVTEKIIYLKSYQLFELTVHNSRISKDKNVRVKNSLIYYRIVKGSKHTFNRIRRGGGAFDFLVAICKCNKWK